MMIFECKCGETRQKRDVRWKNIIRELAAQLLTRDPSVMHRSRRPMMLVQRSVLAGAETRLLAR